MHVWCACSAGAKVKTARIAFTVKILLCLIFTDSTKRGSDSFLGFHGSYFRTQIGLALFEQL